MIKTHHAYHSRNASVTLWKDCLKAHRPHVAAIAMLLSAHTNLSLNIKTSSTGNLGWVTRAIKDGWIGPHKTTRNCQQMWWSVKHLKIFQPWDCHRLTVCSVHTTHMRVKLPNSQIFENLHELLNYKSRENCDVPYPMQRPLISKTWLLIWNPGVSACLARFWCTKIAQKLQGSKTPCCCKAAKYKILEK